MHDRVIIHVYEQKLPNDSCICVERLETVGFSRRICSGSTGSLTCGLMQSRLTQRATQNQQIVLHLPAQAYIQHYTTYNSLLLTVMTAFDGHIINL